MNNKEQNKIDMYLRSLISGETITASYSDTYYIVKELKQLQIEFDVYTYDDQFFIIKLR